MANLVEVVQKFLRPYYYHILALILFILFSLVGWYAYNNFYLKNKTKFSDTSNANRRNIDVNVYFFHVDWCPHCKTALPEWSKFASQFDGQEINGYVVRCVDMNCTEETSEVKTLMDTYNIQSFPTVKMLKDGNAIEYDSKISADTLKQFCLTMLNQ